jgi:hypothetical protein
MLVLKEFRMDKNADEFLSIVGKESGWLATVLAWIGLGPVTALRCGRNALKFVSSSIRNGNRSISVPSSAVTAVAAGFYKPFMLLVIAAVSFVATLVFLILTCSVDINEDIAGFFIFMCLAFAICGAVCVVRYKNSAFLQISVYDGGDLPIIAMRVKRSVIDGVTVDLEKFQNAADLLNDTVMESRSGITNCRETCSTAT